MPHGRFKQLYAGYPADRLRASVLNGKIKRCDASGTRRTRYAIACPSIRDAKSGISNRDLFDIALFKIAVSENILHIYHLGHYHACRC
jgi:hypothetical protein